MHKDFDPTNAAAILVEACRTGALLTALPVEDRPTTMAEGYDVQDRLIAELGQRTVGWKLAVGSFAQKRRLGVGRSIAGRLLESHVHRDGETISLPNAAPATIEFEIVYVLGRDIQPDEPEFPALEAVGETRVAFELVRSRFVDRRAVGWPSFAADNAAFQALVLGEAIDWDSAPALAESLSVTVDGKEAARALSGEDVTDPEAALADLVATARERGMVLPKGGFISTGTVSKPFDIAAPSATVEANFLGRTLRFQTLAAQPPLPPG